MSIYSDRGRPPPSSVQPASQDEWLDCCQSQDVHRFDCPEAPRERRGKGPFLPTRDGR